MPAFFSENSWIGASLPWTLVWPSGAMVGRPRHEGGVERRIIGLSRWETVIESEQCHKKQQA